jgi:flagellar basal body-associated protein FliL
MVDPTLPTQQASPQGAPEAPEEQSTRFNFRRLVPDSSVPYILRLGDLFGSVEARDRLTRRAAVLFLLSLAGALGTIIFAIYHYYGSTRRKIRTISPQSQLTILMKKERTQLQRRAILYPLGTFVIEVKNQSHDKPVSGVINLAELDVMLECDTAETWDYLEAHADQAKNQLTNVFTPIERDMLLSMPGKKALKGLIIKRLNDWLPSGRIKQVYFSRLLVS